MTSDTIARRCGVIRSPRVRSSSMTSPKSWPARSMRSGILAATCRCNGPCKRLRQGRSDSIATVPEFVQLEVDDGVGLVRLDRPPANAIDHQVGLELQEVLREAEGRDDVGALVVWGGRKLFAAGADVKAMADHGPSEIGPVVAALGDALDLLESIPKISIAAINGYALGGGFELALAAD